MASALQQAGAWGCLHPSPSGLLVLPLPPPTCGDRELKRPPLPASWDWARWKEHAVLWRVQPLLGGTGCRSLQGPGCPPCWGALGLAGHGQCRAAAAHLSSSKSGYWPWTAALLGQGGLQCLGLVPLVSARIAPCPRPAGVVQAAVTELSKALPWAPTLQAQVWGQGW